MDIQQLKYYRELCRVKNFTEAGFACSLSQSALSKQIRRLEKELNVTLIRRNTRKFELTEEGEIFLEYAGQALERYGKMLEDIHSKKEIHIGSMTVLSPYHFAKVLAAFHEQHPDIDLVLDEHPADQIVAHIDEYDFAILRTLLITDTERYCMLPLYDDYLCAVVYSSHPLAGERVFGSRSSRMRCSCSRRREAAGMKHSMTAVSGRASHRISSMSSRRRTRS